MSEHQISVSIPLDGDGFLRRECPACEREFKWFQSPEGAGAVAPEGGYFCPYCAMQAKAGSWFTKPQADHLAQVGAHTILGPAIEDMRRDFEAQNQPDSAMKVSMETSVPDMPIPLSEDDDMRRVDFDCHPSEPVKVLGAWDEDVHCLVCGLVAKPASP